MGQSTAEPSLASQAMRTPVVQAPGAETVLRRLAACLAHHVNNALTGVIGYLELGLRDSSAKGNHHAHLQAGLACAYQAADTVKRLVAFTAREKPPNERAPVSLQLLAEEAALKVKQTGHSGLTVLVTGHAPSLVLGSENLLRSAIEQIVRNAVEAMPKVGTLTLRLEERHDCSRLHITDTGAGLSAEAEAHLYDPFWTTKRNGHLGLGLLLCRDVLEALGGKLSVATERGAGTTVTLSLPTATTEVAPSTILSPSNGTLVQSPI